MPNENGFESADTLNQSGDTGVPNPEQNQAQEGPDPNKAVFDTGYGKGIEKGMKSTLKALGLPEDIEVARSHIAELKQPPSEPQDPAPKQGQDPKVAEFARDAQASKSALEAAQKQIEILSRQADEARLAKIRAKAMGAGVGESQSDALLALYGDQFEMSETGKLEVVSEINGTRVSGAVQVEDFLTEITEKNPWMLVPRNVAGSGYDGATQSPEESGPTGIAAYDRRPFSERRQG